MKPGVYDNISNDDYHGGPGTSKSGLDIIHRSPMHFKAARDARAANDNEPQAPTIAQSIGSAFHCIVLEPELFAKTYVLGLRQMDAPDAIGDKEQMVAMVAELNKGRLPKLASSGSKSELAERIASAWKEDAAQLQRAKDVAAAAPEVATTEWSGEKLKAEIARLNETRHGLLSTTGSMQELAQLLRDNGRPVTLWSDVKAEWLQNNQGRVVLSDEQFEQLRGMRDSVMAHPAARALLTGAPGKAELSVYWKDPATGMLMRCRPDFWRMGDGIIVDLKSTEDASPEGFAKSIVNWRYHVQSPFYMDGINHMLTQCPYDSGSGVDPIVPVRAFAFVAVEKKAPYAVGVYVLDEDSLKLGRIEYVQDMLTLADCEASEQWPGYGDKIQNISVPQWHMARNAHLLEQDVAA